MNTSTILRWARLLLLVLALASLAAPALAAEGTATATVNTGRLNVRAGPGVGYAILIQIDQGQSMTLLGRNAEATWVRMRLPSGLEGWVSARYILASEPVANLPISTVTPVEVAATVTVGQLELRAGPGTQHAVLANLGQGHTLALLGRTADSAWVKVRAFALGEGWVAAQVTVRLPGNENGVPTTPFQTNVSVSSLPVVSGSTSGGSPPPAARRVTLSSGTVRPAAPVFVTVEGFPAHRDIAAVLTSRQVPIGFVIANGRTDANGYAQLYFRMPDMWPSGALIAEPNLSLAVGTTDGAVLIWNGLTYQP